MPTGLEKRIRELCANAVAAKGSEDLIALLSDLRAALDEQSTSSGPSSRFDSIRARRILFLICAEVRSLRRAPDAHANVRRWPEEPMTLATMMQILNRSKNQMRFVLLLFVFLISLFAISAKAQMMEASTTPAPGTAPSPARWR
jgi:hypothetical protein